MSTPRNNLPIQLSTFIGREHEFAEVRRLLGTARLITLTGAGGCGKTALALHVGREFASQFLYADGVYWVELAPLAEPALLPEAVMKGLGLREQAGRTLTDTLLDYLRDKELLLVLDNCEHLIEACAELVTVLLHTCPGLHVLSTSREALNIAGEVAWIVPSLQCPTSDVQGVVAASDRGPAALDIGQYDAVRLFVERAHAVQVGFKLTRANASAVARICLRLGGLPLAIELAAARINVLSVEQVAARLDDALGMLTAGKRSAPPRHQTLRAALKWSHDLLSQTEQLLFRRLSVFAGSFSLAAAEAICTSEDIGADDVLPMLARLVDKSLLIKGEAGDEARYRLLEPVRQYSFERLREAGEADRVANRHLSWYGALAETGERQLDGPDQLAWFERLELEHDNLRAALGWSLADDERGESALRLAIALSRFWFRRGYNSDGRAWLNGALLNVARALKRVEGEGGASPLTPAVLPQSLQRARAAALGWAGELARGQGDFDAAQALQQESMAIARQIEDPVGLAFALQRLGFVMLSMAGPSPARPMLSESLRIFRELGDTRGIAVSTGWLAHVVREEGDTAGARALFEEALKSFRERGDQADGTWMLYQLGNLAEREGDHAKAGSLLEESLMLFREYGDRRGISEALVSLGDVKRRLGEPAAAQSLYQDGLALSRQVGIQWVSAWCLAGLGQLAMRSGDYARAVALFREGLGLNLGRARQDQIAKCVAGVAAVLAYQEQSTAALTSARLFGAAEVRLRPLWDYDAAIDHLRARLGTSALEGAWAEGRALSLAQARAEAEQVTITQAITPAKTASAREPATLTARELDVLRWLARGLSDAQIAEQLVISPRTVGTHLTSIYGKLGVNSRSAATRYALEHQLV